MESGEGPLYSKFDPPLRLGGGSMTREQNVGSTVELANMALVLRDDLEFKLQRHGDALCYLIEDEKNSKFYRVGIPEYSFISLLDGTTTVREALALTASQLGNDALTENDAGTICKWLIDSQLARTEASLSADRLIESSQKSQGKKRVQWLNPLIVRLPLFRPDAFLGWLTNVLGWWISWPAFAVWLFTILLAVHQLATHGRSMPTADERIFAPGNWIWLAITWSLLKLVHELSHGLACKVFGGNVREAGVVMITFAPVPYVDVTTSWRFRSKWKRIFVAAAGMYTELFLAAIAAIVFVHAPPGMLREQSRNIMFTGSLVTLLFNANPLMRFDGYYMLSDWLDIPNLYISGQQYTQYLGRRYVMGVKTRFPKMPTWKSLFVRAYGLLSMVWRVVVCAGMLTAAATLFKGVGIVLAFFGAILWIGHPCWKLMRYMLGIGHRDRPNRKQFALVGGTMLASLVALMLMPEPGGVRAPGVVVYKPKHVVRAPHAGFVTAVNVESGTLVTVGQVLVTLDNPDLRLEFVELQLAREQSEYHSRQFHNTRDIAAKQLEKEMLAATEEQLAERREQLNNSVIRAPAAGRVVARNVQSIVGTFVEEGEALFAIGDESQKQIELSVEQEDVDTFGRFMGQMVDVRLTRQPSTTLACTLVHVEPSASRQLQNPALAAAHGGPLAVKPSADSDSERAEWELIAPRFVGDVALTANQSRLLQAGQVAHVRLNASRGSMGAYCFRQVADWIERRLAPRP